MLLCLLISLLSLCCAQCITPVCDSFDTYTGSLTNAFGYGPNNLTANVATRGSLTNATVDSTFSWSAPNSLRINCSAANQTNAVLVYTPATGWPQLYGRTMVYYSNASQNGLPTDVHSWIFAANGDNQYFATHNDTSINATAPSSNVGVNIIVGTGNPPKVAVNYGWSRSEATLSSNKTNIIQANQWFCLQWHFDGPNSNAKVWVDGVLYINITHDPTFTNYTPVNYNSSHWRFADKPGWARMQYGFTHYQTLSRGVELHLDDYALDKVMTCCPCQLGDTRSHCCPDPVTTYTPTQQNSAPTSAPTINGTNNVPNGGLALVASLLVPLILIFGL